MNWDVKYIPEARKDLKKLDHSQKLVVLKAIQKVQANPLPDYNGGYGKPLSNRASSKLAGFMKIKLKKHGLRIVYTVVKEEGLMKIIIISLRDDEMVYKLAQKRIIDEMDNG
jgi:mRNA interferase RelE/StbE